MNKKFLYVGCGAHRIKGFTHVEISVFKQFKKGRNAGKPEIIADITRRIPLKSKSVKLIFSRATLEHLKYRELLNHFIECHRLLAIGGVVRMTVPDLDIMVNKFIKKNEDLDAARQEAAFANDMPVDTHTDIFIRRLLDPDHYYLHNFETLSKALKNTGFSAIRRAEPGDTIVSEVKEQLRHAELGRNEWEVIVEAQKLDSVPEIEKSETKTSGNFLSRLLADCLNLKIERAYLRRPRFPSRMYFLEKYRLASQFFIKK